MTTEALIMLAQVLPLFADIYQNLHTSNVICQKQQKVVKEMKK